MVEDQKEKKMQKEEFPTNDVMDSREQQWNPIFGGTGGGADWLLRRFPEYEVVHPIKTDKTGSFLSHDLSHHVSKIHKRDLSSNHNHSVYYKIHHNGEDLYFNLSINYNLLAPGFVTERHQGGIARAKIQIYRHNSCHFFGEVLNYTSTTGSAAISTCNGLKGVFRLSNEDYFIEPLKGPQEKDGAAQPHMIYKRHISQNREEEMLTDTTEYSGRKQSNIARTCGLKDSQKTFKKSEKQRERWEQKQRRKRRIKQRSISKEKWVETLVVADTKMVKYHGNDNIENYVLTVMNMVAGLFHDASIGNSINIVVVRLILLEEEEENLKITHHADNSLASFCKWQKSINVKGDSHPTHHDVAVLLTRKDICAAMNRPCETLGLSHVSGMCQPHRSCNINEDTGLPLAFTVAHELGHSFGIQHDGSGNDCEPVGKRPFIMSPQLLYDTSPLTWSRCSREYITRFLDRGWGLCLDDPPAKEVIEFPLVPPGVLYNVNHQCRLQYGAESSFCDDMDNVCNTLWCTVGSTCHSKLDAAVDGTKCGERKWCFNGECVPVGYRPDRVNGGWGSWSSWSACTRTCGAGVQKAERQCDNPRPKYGGKFCLGERTRFRICDIKPCPSDKLTFRHIQCSQFDTMPYKGKLYEWVPVPSTINPCELHCRPLEEYFSEKLLDAVIDGTPCYEGTTIRDICINGICKNVGCDYEIDSNAVEDRCGVCQGDSSTCETVKRTFEESEGLGYVDIGIIPPGAREIRIEEVAEAGNFLALRSEDPEKYFLNGGWTIQWNGDYKVAGTTFTYERTGNWENLTSPGPTKEPVWIQLLFQETNPGVRYQYTVRRDFDNENEIQPPDFSWRYGSWTKCTATCGRGVQRQIVHCVEKIVGIVEERYCDYLTRPDDKQRSCSEEPCPARWWIGEWQECSATCGDTGFMKRTVLCIQSVGLDEQRALNNSDCQHVHKPESISPCNGNSLCPTEWSVGDWSECSVTCGEGIQRRLVYCGNNSTKTCDTTQKPISKALCYLQKCPSKITDNFITEWSGSGASSKEIFNEINYISNNQNPNFSPEAKNKKNSEEDYNINNVIEEEISITNHRKDTESSSKNNVFVDDFYYDYNFINFHEDLSYYPGDNENKTEESITKTYDEIFSKDNSVLDGLQKELHDYKENVTPHNLGANVNSGIHQSRDVAYDFEDLTDQEEKSKDYIVSTDLEHINYNPDEQPIRDIKATEVTPTLYYNAEVEEEEEEREPSFYENNQFLPLHNATDKHFEKTQPNYLPPSNHTADNKQQGGQVANTVSKEEIQLEISSTSIPSVLSPTLSAVHSTVHYTATKQTYNQIKGDYISNQNTLQITEDPSRVNLNSEDENLRWKEVNDDTADTSKGKKINHAGSVPVHQDIANITGNMDIGNIKKIIDNEHNFTQHIDNNNEIDGNRNDKSDQFLQKNYEDETHTYEDSNSRDKSDKTNGEGIKSDYRSDKQIGNNTQFSTEQDSETAAERLYNKTKDELTVFTSDSPITKENNLSVVSANKTWKITQKPNYFLKWLNNEAPTHKPYTESAFKLVGESYKYNKDKHISDNIPLDTTETSSSTVMHHASSLEMDRELDKSLSNTGIPFLSYSNVANDHIEITSEVITEPLHISSSTIPPDYLYRTAILKNSFSQTSTSEGDIYHNTYLTSTPAFSYQSDLGPTTGILDKPVSLEPLQQTTEIDSNEIKVPYKMMKFNPHDKPHEVPHTTEKIENKNIKQDNHFLNQDENHGTTMPHVLTKTKNISESSPSSVPPNVAPSKPVPVISKEVYWEVGRWSECSTTCGLGAIWRMVQCSTGSDADCDITKKPAPARRCYLRPCSKWSVGNWSKCSKNCGGGVKVREVQCIDTRDYRLLRPFHCRAALLKPPVQISCNSKSCMGWYISSWSECTEMCGGGEQERLVTCPEFGRCDDELRPNSTKACNSHPCTKWVVGSWGQCSATCGGGIQRRLVKCINTKTNQAEEDTSLCDHEPWPENTQKCNTQECDIVKPNNICYRDRLKFSFCQTLKILGRCQLPTVEAQCCYTCRPHGQNNRDRGNERVSRR
ncbi:A disintegrin and metalloproteinase with thrombospondin motifs 7 [Latimeria chalumnae]|uniref:A disintegrin and metalloproteinase with thrombospondin motifs 7 n=1 Tax=Latimeria chalumnae TaxID=7897 RepID=UPI00313C0F66